MVFEWRVADENGHAQEGIGALLERSVRPWWWCVHPLTAGIVFNLIQHFRSACPQFFGLLQMPSPVQYSRRTERARLCLEDRKAMLHEVGETGISFQRLIALA